MLHFRNCNQSPANNMGPWHHSVVKKKESPIIMRTKIELRSRTQSGMNVNMGGGFQNKRCSYTVA